MCDAMSRDAMNSVVPGAETQAPNEGGGPWEMWNGFRFTMRSGVAASHEPRSSAAAGADAAMTQAARMEIST